MQGNDSTVDSNVDATGKVSLTLNVGQSLTDIDAGLVPNTAPVANDDSYSTFINTPLTITTPGVLANDTDAELDTLSVAYYDQPNFGSVTLNPDGSFTYTPSTDFVGIDSFFYGEEDKRERDVNALVMAA